ncbi:Pollen-specific protein C13 [Acorus calamus]|uniref:Pollen-specific protein C13 n=1 Tax=Acorus calamus TaxID=4465 RepID=A0AAV9EXB8_ACOCL|nr:Pollen-specific protein C13 [Acorus calamus]
MAKLQTLCVLVALCFLSTLVVAFSQSEHKPTFIVQGRVYCDTCRAGFETPATIYIPGANVKIECRNFTTGVVSYTGTGVTDESGTYKLEVVDEREDEICDVALVSSPIEECTETKEGRDRARIVLTHNNGMSSNVRYANSLGFLRDVPFPICGQLLLQYAMGDEE